MVGIISNTSALNAQTNLNKASADSAASISRLSSGSRIARAADDVAGLAVGTILQTNVSTLKAALSNTSQANSLLGVADGALKNIGDLLQRQKALASQATSGSLTDQARGFLNQEFQNLKSEIDRIAGTTNFNGIKLIDGSLFAPTDLKTNTSNTAVATSGTINFANGAMVDTAAITIQAGPVGATNSVTITYRSNANYLGANSNALNINIGGGTNGFVAGAAGNNDATNFMTAINNILNSTDTTASVVAAKNILSGLNFTRNGSAITITSKAAGVYYNGTGNGISVKEANLTNVDDLTINGANSATGYTALSTAGTAGTGNDTTTTPKIDGYLNAGSFNSTANTAYGGTATTIAQGTVTDTLLTSLTTSAIATTGVNFSGVSNNADFVGKISGFQATYNQAGFADVSVKVGDYTYLAKNVNTAPTAATIVRFASVEDGGGYFDLQFDTATNSGQTAITDQSDANNFANRINQALSGVTAYQQRQVSSYSAVGSVYNTSGSSIGNLTGTNFNLFGSDFDNQQIQDVQVTAGNYTNQVDPTISFTINGEKYVSGFDSNGISQSNLFTFTAGPPSTVTLAANASLGFKSTTNPNNLLVFRNSGTALDLSNADNAASVETALKNALGVGKGGSSLSFQVGTTAADNISVQVQGAKTSDIYKDSNGQVMDTLDISTLAGANAANPILDNAINTVTAIRANVGALQSRFDYAAANINSGIQNQDAARSTYLDTDISAESTQFAQSQVRVQASISVLAQANQLPQNLLKLIG